MREGERYVAEVGFEILQRSAEIDGLHVEWTEAGSGPLAICLHGFPDSAHSWQFLLPELAAAGYRAVAPWTRGYFPTGVPADGLYQAGVRAHDACMLHDALGGGGDAVIIGHDFGAGAANIAATMKPDRWSKVVMMSVPPYSRFRPALFNYAQARRSSYMFFFQHPLSETIVPHDDWAYVRGLWADWSPGFHGAEHVEDFIASASPLGHLQAILGYYRATFQPELRSPEFAEWDAAGVDGPPQPTLYLHGQMDGCIGFEVAEGLETELSPGSRLVLFDSLGHFMQLEDPALVNETIIDFLLQSPSLPSSVN